MPLPQQIPDTKFAVVVIQWDNRFYSGNKKVVPKFFAPPSICSMVFIIWRLMINYNFASMKYINKKLLPTLTREMLSTLVKFINKNENI